MSQFNPNEQNATPPSSPPRPSTPHSITHSDSEYSDAWNTNNLSFLHDVPTPPPFPPRSIRSYRDWMAQYAHFQLTHRPMELFRISIPQTLETLDPQLHSLVTDQQHIEDCVYCHICNHDPSKIVCGCVAETPLVIQYYEHYSLHTYCPTCRHKQYFMCGVLLIEQVHQLSFSNE